MKDKLKKLIDKFWFFSDNYKFEIRYEDKSKPFLNEQPCFNDEAVNKAFKSDNEKWTHESYIKTLKKRVIIEPDYSYCITNFNEIIRSSAFYPKLVPSFPRYLKAALFKPKKRFDKAFLFDGQVGTNYFHFFSDIVNKIWLIQEIEGCFDIPIIIGEKTYKTKYFQYLLNTEDFRKFNWVVQKAGEYLLIDELTLLRPKPYKKAYFERIKDLVISQDSLENKRIFLKRSQATGRYIENFHEIERILQKYQFEIVDTNNTTLEFQANLFNSAQYLITIHGAGATNIIFAQSKLRFLEIIPANRIACQYYWLSKELGIHYYDTVLGGNLPKTLEYPEKGFRLEPENLEKAIIRMINHN